GRHSDAPAGTKGLSVNREAQADEARRWHATTRRAAENKLAKPPRESPPAPLEPDRARPRPRASFLPASSSPGHPKNSRCRFASIFQTNILSATANLRTIKSNFRRPHCRSRSKTQADLPRSGKLAPLSPRYE